MRRAKIVATLGPATDELAIVQKLIKFGLNVARLNMSHGDHSDHKKRLDLVREASKLEGKEIAALADLQGPKFESESLVMVQFHLLMDKISQSQQMTSQVIKKKFQQPIKVYLATLKKVTQYLWMMEKLD